MSEVYQGMTKDDVWGTMGKGGLVVARGLPSSMSKKEKDAICRTTGRPQICPIWKNELGYKSVTVIFEEKDYAAVTYWLEYVHGGGCVVDEKSLPEGKMAIRSDYMCW